MATNLADDGLDVEQGNALILAADDKLEEVVTEHLEDHADVRTVDAADLEIVQQLHCLLAFRVRFVALADAAQQFDLVQRRFRIVRRALHYFERYEPFGSIVPREEQEGRKKKAKTITKILTALRNCNLKKRKRKNGGERDTYTKSQQSHTVEKWPHPSLRTT